jgi:hypothetical protein
MLIFLNRPALKSNGSSASEAYNHIDSKVVPEHAVRAYGGLIGSAALTLCTIGWGGSGHLHVAVALLRGKRPP